MTSQKVSIRYLIDVAIGNPEPGVVNFNALYTVLQAFSQKLDLQDENIEIDSSYCQIGAAPVRSKSHASSEQLVDHQIFDFGSEELADKMKTGATSHRSMSEHIRVVFDSRQEKAGDDGTSSKRGKDDKTAHYRSELRQHIDALNARLGKMENIFASSVEIQQKVNCFHEKLQLLNSDMEELQAKFSEVVNVKKNEEESISACRKRLEQEKIMNVIEELRLEIADVKRMMGKVSPSANGRMTAAGVPYIDQSGLYDELKSEHLRFDGQLIEVRTNVCNLMEKFEFLSERLGSGDNAGANVGMAEHTALQKDLEKHQESMEQAVADIARLLRENDSQKHTITELTNRLEELSKTKIDKEEIDELLTEKADYTMLQRKVSVENMEADRRKIEKQISELAECFLMNDERVQKQIGEIRKLFGDQSLEELLYDLRVKIDREIQIVRDAVKKLAEAKPDADSAITRLRDLSCLACDQEVVMKCLEMNNLSKFGNAYVSQSFSPIITFEIGKLREAGKAGLSDAEENIWDIAKNMRHTGGMHTIITNKDRVDKVTKVKPRRK